MSKKTPAAVFELYFDRHDLYPEEIPWNSLARSLSAVQRLAIGDQQLDDEEEKEGRDELEKDTIRLLGVRRGSARFQCFAACPELAIRHLRLVGSILETPEQAENAEFAFNPIEDLSAIAARLECSIIIRDPATKDVFATIGPKSFDSIAASIFVRGEATVAGRVERVGGATATRCALRVDFQRHLLYCQVAAESVARQLGQHLYEDVVAEGNASFLRTSWRIARFTVTSIYQPKDGSILKTLHEIRQLSGRAWDDVDDPKKYLEEVTGES